MKCLYKLSNPDATHLLAHNDQEKAFYCKIPHEELVAQQLGLLNPEAISLLKEGYECIKKSLVLEFKNSPARLAAFAQLHSDLKQIFIELVPGANEQLIVKK